MRRTAIYMELTSLCNDPQQPDRILWKFGLDLHSPSQYLMTFKADGQTSKAQSATGRSSTHLVWQNLNKIIMGMQ